MNLRRPFLHAVAVVPELAAIIDGCDVIPRAERVKTLAIDQRLLVGPAVHVAVEIPSVVDDAELEQHAIVAAVLLQMKPALRRLAAVRPEDRFPRERRRSRQRVDVDDERSVDTVEFDGLAEGRVDHSRVAEHGRAMTADAIQSIERPQFVVSGRHETDGGEGEERYDEGSNAPLHEPHSASAQRICRDSSAESAWMRLVRSHASPPHFWRGQQLQSAPASIASVDDASAWRVTSPGRVSATAELHA